MNIDTIFDILAIVILSYLLGAIPTAYVIAKLKQVNIFEVGSGNMGATNVSRALGMQWGVLVWLLDAAKGMVAILVAQNILPSNLALATVLSSLFAVVGHNWSIFASLVTGVVRGGKGASTAYGTLLMIAPLPVVLVASALAGAIIALTRYMSLGVLALFSLAMSWLMILVVQQQKEPIFILYAVALILLILYRFRDNIQRLASGTERRVGERV
jgi:acyl phosphate:glycerol-3-phosphate acyltransferase